MDLLHADCLSRAAMVVSEIFRDRLAALGHPAQPSPVLIFILLLFPPQIRKHFSPLRHSRFAESAI